MMDWWCLNQYAIVVSSRAAGVAIDYKESLSLDIDLGLCGFAKDVLALKNVGGGYILVGVQDKTWEQVGLVAPFPYDTKLLRDNVMRATGVALDIDVVTHSLASASTNKRFALILVRASRKRAKRRSPTVVAKDFCAGTPHGLRRGEIYVRHGDSTEKVSTQSQLMELLDRLEDQADEDAVQYRKFAYRTLLAPALPQPERMPLSVIRTRVFHIEVSNR